MSHRPWSDDLRQQARALYASDGAKLASEVTGVPLRTVQRWAMAERWAAPSDDATSQAPHLHVAPAPDVWRPDGRGRHVPAGYGLARRLLLRRLGDTAGLALDHVERELGQGHTSKARDCAIALDRAEVLAKAVGDGVGGAVPSVAEARARLAELAADLTARSTGSDGHPR
jgi:hypothetical protein